MRVTAIGGPNNPVCLKLDAQDGRELSISFFGMEEKIHGYSARYRADGGIMIYHDSQPKPLVEVSAGYFSATEFLTAIADFMGYDLVKRPTR